MSRRRRWRAFAVPALVFGVAGRRTGHANLLVERTDDGDGVKGAGDALRIVAQER